MNNNTNNQEIKDTLQRRKELEELYKAKKQELTWTTKVKDLNEIILEGRDAIGRVMEKVVHKNNKQKTLLYTEIPTEYNDIENGVIRKKIGTKRITETKKGQKIDILDRSGYSLTHQKSSFNIANKEKKIDNEAARIKENIRKSFRGEDTDILMKLLDKGDSLASQRSMHLKALVNWYLSQSKITQEQFTLGEKTINAYKTSAINRQKEALKIVEKKEGKNSTLYKQIDASSQNIDTFYRNSLDTLSKIKITKKIPKYKTPGDELLAKLSEVDAQAEDFKKRVREPQRYPSEEAFEKDFLYFSEKHRSSSLVKFYESNLEDSETLKKINTLQKDNIQRYNQVISGLGSLGKKQTSFISKVEPYMLESDVLNNYRETWNKHHQEKYNTINVSKNTGYSRVSPDGVRINQNSKSKNYGFFDFETIGIRGTDSFAPTQFSIGVQTKNGFKTESGVLKLGESQRRYIEELLQRLEKPDLLKEKPFTKDNIRDLLSLTDFSSSTLVDGKPYITAKHKHYIGDKTINPSDTELINRINEGFRVLTDTQEYANRYDDIPSGLKHMRDKFKIDTFVGHNIREFDNPIAKKYGMDIPQFIDTIELARSYYSQGDAIYPNGPEGQSRRLLGFSLSNLADFFGIDKSKITGTQHTAEYDIELDKLVFDKLINNIIKDKRQYKGENVGTIKLGQIGKAGRSYFRKNVTSFMADPQDKTSEGILHDSKNSWNNLLIRNKGSYSWQGAFFNGEGITAKLLDEDRGNEVFLDFADETAMKTALSYVFDGGFKDIKDIELSDQQAFASMFDRSTGIYNLEAMHKLINASNINDVAVSNIQKTRFKKLKQGRNSYFPIIEKIYSLISDKTLDLSNEEKSMILSSLGHKYGIQQEQNFTPATIRNEIKSKSTKNVTSVKSAYLDYIEKHKPYFSGEAYNDIIGMIENIKMHDSDLETNNDDLSKMSDVIYNLLSDEYKSSQNIKAKVPKMYQKRIEQDFTDVKEQVLSIFHPKTTLARALYEAGSDKFKNALSGKYLIERYKKLGVDPKNKTIESLLGHRATQNPDVAFAENSVIFMLENLESKLRESGMGFHYAPTPDERAIKFGFYDPGKIKDVFTFNDQGMPVPIWDNMVQYTMPLDLGDGILSNNGMPVANAFIPDFEDGNTIQKTSMEHMFEALFETVTGKYFNQNILNGDYSKAQYSLNQKIKHASESMSSAGTYKILNKESIDQMRAGGTPEATILRSNMSNLTNWLRKLAITYLGKTQEQLTTYNERQLMQYFIGVNKGIDDIFYNSREHQWILENGSNVDAVKQKMKEYGDIHKISMEGMKEETVLDNIISSAGSHDYVLGANLHPDSNRAADQRANYLVRKKKHQPGIDPYFKKNIFGMRFGVLSGIDYNDENHLLFEAMHVNEEDIVHGYEDLKNRIQDGIMSDTESSLFEGTNNERLFYQNIQDEFYSQLGKEIKNKNEKERKKIIKNNKDKLQNILLQRMGRLLPTVENDNMIIRGSVIPEMNSERPTPKEFSDLLSLKKFLGHDKLIQGLDTLEDGKILTFNGDGIEVDGKFLKSIEKAGKKYRLDLRENIDVKSGQKFVGGWGKRASGLEGQDAMIDSIVRQALHSENPNFSSQQIEKMLSNTDPAFLLPKTSLGPKTLMEKVIGRYGFLISTFLEQETKRLITETGVSQEEAYLTANKTIQKKINESTQIAKNYFEFDENMKLWTTSVVRDHDSNFVYTDNKGNPQYLFGNYTIPEGLSQEELEKTQEDIKKEKNKMMKRFFEEDIDDFGKALFGDKYQYMSKNMIVEDFGIPNEYKIIDNGQGSVSDEFLESAKQIKIGNREKDSIFRKIKLANTKVSTPFLEMMTSYVSNLSEDYELLEKTAMNYATALDDTADIAKNAKDFDYYNKYIEKNKDNIVKIVRGGSLDVGKNEVHIDTLRNTKRFTGGAVSKFDWQNSAMGIIEQKINELGIRPEDAKIILDLKNRDTGLSDIAMLEGFGGIDKFILPFLNADDLGDGLVSPSPLVGKFESLIRAITSIQGQSTPEQQEKLNTVATEMKNEIKKSILSKDGFLYKQLNNIKVPNAKYFSTNGINIEQYMTDENFRKEMEGSIFLNPADIMQMLTTGEGGNIDTNIRNLLNYYREMTGQDLSLQQSAYSSKSLYEKAIINELIKEIDVNSGKNNFLYGMTHRYPSSSGLDMIFSKIKSDSSIAIGAYRSALGLQLRKNEDNDGDKAQVYFPWLKHKLSNGDFSEAYKQMQRTEQFDHQVSNLLGIKRLQSYQNDVLDSKEETNYNDIFGNYENNLFRNVETLLSKVNKDKTGPFSNYSTAVRNILKKYKMDELTDINDYNSNIGIEQVQQNAKTQLFRALLEAFEQDALSTKKVGDRLKNVVNKSQEKGFSSAGSISDDILGSLSILNNMLNKGKDIDGNKYGSDFSKKWGDITSFIQEIGILGKDFDSRQVWNAIAHIQTYGDMINYKGKGLFGGKELLKDLGIGYAAFEQNEKTGEYIYDITKPNQAGSVSIEDIKRIAIDVEKTFSQKTGYKNGFADVRWNEEFKEGSLTSVDYKNMGGKSQLAPEHKVDSAVTNLLNESKQRENAVLREMDAEQKKIKVAQLLAKMIQLETQAFADTSGIKSREDALKKMESVMAEINAIGVDSSLYSTIGVPISKGFFSSLSSTGDMVSANNIVGSLPGNNIMELSSDLLTALNNMSLLDSNTKIEGQGIWTLKKEGKLHKYIKDNREFDKLHGENAEHYTVTQLANAFSEYAYNQDPHKEAKYAFAKSFVEDDNQKTITITSKDGFSAKDVEVDSLIDITKKTQTPFFKEISMLASTYRGNIVHAAMEQIQNAINDETIDSKLFYNKDGNFSYRKFQQYGKKYYQAFKQEKEKEDKYFQKATGYSIDQDQKSNYIAQITMMQNLKDKIQNALNKPEFNDLKGISELSLATSYLTSDGKYIDIAGTFDSLVAKTLYDWKTTTDVHPEVHKYQLSALKESLYANKEIIMNVLKNQESFNIDKLWQDLQAFIVNVGGKEGIAYGFDTYSHDEFLERTNYARAILKSNQAKKNVSKYGPMIFKENEVDVTTLPESLQKAYDVMQSLTGFREYKLRSKNYIESFANENGWTITKRKETGNSLIVTFKKLDEITGRYITTLLKLDKATGSVVGDKIFNYGQEESNIDRYQKLLTETLKQEKVLSELNKKPDINAEQIKATQKSIDKSKKIMGSLLLAEDEATSDKIKKDLQKGFYRSDEARILSANIQDNEKNNLLTARQNLIDAEEKFGQKNAMFYVEKDEQQREILKQELAQSLEYLNSMKSEYSNVMKRISGIDGIDPTFLNHFKNFGENIDNVGVGVTRKYVESYINEAIAKQNIANSSFTNMYRKGYVTSEDMDMSKNFFKEMDETRLHIANIMEKFGISNKDIIANFSNVFDENKVIQSAEQIRDSAIVTEKKQGVMKQYLADLREYRILMEDILVLDNQFKQSGQSVFDQTLYRDKKKALSEQAETVLARMGTYNEKTGEIIKTGEDGNSFVYTLNSIENEKFKSKISSLNTYYEDRQIRKDVNSKKKGFFSDFMSMMKNELVYYAGRGLTYEIIGMARMAITSLIQQTEQFNSTMIDIRIVTGAAKEEVSDMIDEYNNMAKQLGVTTQEVAASANQFLRMGYNAEATAELIKQSMMLSKLGMIEAGQAAEYLTSAIKGYQLSYEEASKVVDMATTLDMSYAVDAGYIFQAMARTATSAKLARVEMAELQSMIAVIGETTQKDASVIGESLKTAFARYGNVKSGVAAEVDMLDLDEQSKEELENVNDIEKVLTKYNIDIREVDNKTWRSYSDIMKDVNEQWDKFSDFEKNAITTAMFGTRQRENGLVVLENYNEVLKATSKAINSEGNALRKYSIYQEGVTAAKNRMTASWEGFIQDISLSKGLENFYKLLGDIIDNLKIILWMGTSFAAIFNFDKIIIGAGKFFNILGGGILNKKSLFGQVFKNPKEAINGVKNSYFSALDQVQDDALDRNALHSEFQTTNTILKNILAAIKGEDVTNIVNGNNNQSKNNNVTVKENADGSIISTHSNGYTSRKIIDKDSGITNTSYYDKNNNLLFEKKSGEMIGDNKLSRNISYNSDGIIKGKMTSYMDKNLGQHVTTYYDANGNVINQIISSKNKKGYTDTSFYNNNDGKIKKTKGIRQRKERNGRIVRSIYGSDNDFKRSEVISNVDGKTTIKKYDSSHILYATDESYINERGMNVRKVSNRFGEPVYYSRNYQDHKGRQITETIHADGSVTRNYKQKTFFTGREKDISKTYTSEEYKKKDFKNHTDEDVSKREAAINNLWTSIGSISGMIGGMSLGNQMFGSTGSFVGMMLGPVVVESLGGLITKVFKGITPSVSSGIVGITVATIAGIASYIKKEEEKAIKRAETRVVESSNQVESLESSKEKFNRYDILARGVNQFGNNVSLSDLEYEEFINLGNELGETYPSLITRITETGDALLGFEGQVGNLTQNMKIFEQTLKEINASNETDNTLLKSQFESNVETIDEYKSNLKDINKFNNMTDKKYISKNSSDYIISKDKLSDEDIKILESLGYKKKEVRSQNYREAGYWESLWINIKDEVLGTNEGWENIYQIKKEDVEKNVNLKRIILEQQSKEKITEKTIKEQESKIKKQSGIFTSGMIDNLIHLDSSLNFTNDEKSMIASLINEIIPNINNYKDWFRSEEDEIINLKNDINGILKEINNNGIIKSGFNEMNTFNDSMTLDEIRAKLIGTDENSGIINDIKNELFKKNSVIVHSLKDQGYNIDFKKETIEKDGKTKSFDEYIYSLTPQGKSIYDLNTQLKYKTTDINGNESNLYDIDGLSRDVLQSFTQSELKELLGMTQEEVKNIVGQAVGQQAVDNLRTQLIINTQDSIDDIAYTFSQSLKNIQDNAGIKIFKDLTDEDIIKKLDSMDFSNKTNQEIQDMLKRWGDGVEDIDDSTIKYLERLIQYADRLDLSVGEFYNRAKELSHLDLNGISLKSASALQEDYSTLLNIREAILNEGVINSKDMDTLRKSYPEIYNRAALDNPEKFSKNMIGAILDQINKKINIYDSEDNDVGVGLYYLKDNEGYWDTILDNQNKLKWAKNLSGAMDASKYFIGEDFDINKDYASDEYTQKFNDTNRKKIIDLGIERIKQEQNYMSDFEAYEYMVTTYGDSKDKQEYASLTNDSQKEKKAIEITERLYQEYIDWIQGFSDKVPTLLKDAKTQGISINITNVRERAEQQTSQYYGLKDLRQNIARSKEDHNEQKEDIDKKKEDLAEQKALNEIENFLQRRNLLIEEYNNKISNYDWALEMIAPQDYESKIDLNGEKIKENINKYQELTKQYDELASRTPKTDGEAQKIAESMKSISDQLPELMKNIYKAEETIRLIALDSISESINDITDAFDRQRNILNNSIDLSMSFTGVESNLSLLTMDFSPLIENESEIEKKKREYQEGLDIQEEYQQKSLDSQKEYLDLLEETQNKEYLDQLDDLTREERRMYEDREKTIRDFYQQLWAYAKSGTPLDTEEYKEIMAYFEEAKKAGAIEILPTFTQREDGKWIFGGMDVEQPVEEIDADKGIGALKKGEYANKKDKDNTDANKDEKEKADKEDSEITSANVNTKKIKEDTKTKIYNATKDGHKAALDEYHTLVSENKDYQLKAPSLLTDNKSIEGWGDSGLLANMKSTLDTTYQNLNTYSKEQKIVAPIPDETTWKTFGEAIAKYISEGMDIGLQLGLEKDTERAIPMGENAGGSGISYSSGGSGHVSGNSIVNLAQKQVGKPYIFGAGRDGSDNAFDCSGLTQWLYKQHGINIGSSAVAQWNENKGVRIDDISQLQPGDLLFYENTYKPGISHVGVYAGNGKMIDARGTSYGVVERDADFGSHYVGAKRYHDGGIQVNTNSVMGKVIAQSLNRNNIAYGGSLPDGITTQDFDANEISNLAYKDIMTELPRLSQSEIKSIISKYFSKSTVISPSDARGIYDAQQNTGMSALALLAIGALESGYGTSNIAKKKNNIWGWKATNIDPGKNAKTFEQMSEGAKTYARDVMNLYYHKRGATSIYKMGSGDNLEGVGYAYYDDGTIDASWVTKVSNIMSKFMNSLTSYSSGTSHHQGGPALLGDENLFKGSNIPSPETLIYPNGKLEIVGQDGPIIKDIPVGTQVLTTKQTKQLFKNIPNYAKGTETNTDTNSEKKTEIVDEEQLTEDLSKIESTLRELVAPFNDRAKKISNRRTSKNIEKVSTLEQYEAIDDNTINYVERVRNKAMKSLYLKGDLIGDFYQEIELYQEEQSKFRDLYEEREKAGASTEELKKIADNIIALDEKIKSTNNEIEQWVSEMISYATATLEAFKSAREHNERMLDLSYNLGLIGKKTDENYYNKKIEESQKIQEETSKSLNQAIETVINAALEAGDTYEQALQQVENNAEIRQLRQDVLAEKEREKATRVEKYNAINTDIERDEIPRERFFKFFGNDDVDRIKDIFYRSSEGETSRTQSALEKIKNAYDQLNDPNLFLSHEERIAKIDEYNNGIVEYYTVVKEGIEAVGEAYKNAYQRAMDLSENREALGITTDKKNGTYWKKRISYGETYYENLATQYANLEATKFNALLSEKNEDGTNKYTVAQINEILKNDSELNAKAMEMYDVRKDIVQTREEELEYQQQQIEYSETLLDLEKAERFSNMSAINNYYNSKQSMILKEINSLKESLKWEDLSHEEYIKKAMELAEKEKELDDLMKDRLKSMQEFYSRQYDSMNYMVNEYISALNDEKDAISETYDEEINKLQTVNEQKERSIKLTELQMALDNAKKEKKRVYRAGVGFVYEEDRDKINEAEKALDDFYRQDNLDNLNKAKDLELKALDERIEGWNKYLEAIEKVYKTAERHDNMKAVEALYNVTGWQGIFDVLNSDSNAFLQNKKLGQDIYYGVNTDLLHDYTAVSERIFEKMDESISLLQDISEHTKSDDNKKGKADIHIANPSYLNDSEKINEMSNPDLYWKDYQYDTDDFSAISEEKIKLLNEKYPNIKFDQQIMETFSTKKTNELTDWMVNDVLVKNAEDGMSWIYDMLTGKVKNTTGYSHASLREAYSIGLNKIINTDFYDKFADKDFDDLISKEIPNFASLIDATILTGGNEYNLSLETLLRLRNKNIDNNKNLTDEQKTSLKKEYENMPTASELMDKYIDNPSLYFEDFDNKYGKWANVLSLYDWKNNSHFNYLTKDMVKQLADEEEKRGIRDNVDTIIMSNETLQELKNTSGIAGEILNILQMAYGTPKSAVEITPETAKTNIVDIGNGVGPLRNPEKEATSIQGMVQHIYNNSTNYYVAKTGGSEALKAVQKTNVQTNSQL